MPRRFGISSAVFSIAILLSCSTAGPLTPIATPTKIIVTDQNGNVVTQIADAQRLQQLTAFINQQRTEKQWRVHDRVPVFDVVLHLCHGNEPEGVFGTQTRLFSSDGHDTPAQSSEVDALLSLLGADRTLFTRLPLNQRHADVSCR